MLGDWLLTDDWALIISGGETLDPRGVDPYHRCALCHTYIRSDNTLLKARWNKVEVVLHVECAAQVLVRQYMEKD